MIKNLPVVSQHYIKDTTIIAEEVNALTGSEIGIKIQSDIIHFWSAISQLLSCPVPNFVTHQWTTTITATPTTTVDPVIRYADPMPCGIEFQTVTIHHRDQSRVVVIKDGNHRSQFPPLKTTLAHSSLWIVAKSLVQSSIPSTQWSALRHTPHSVYTTEKSGQWGHGPNWTTNPRCHHHLGGLHKVIGKLLHYTEFCIQMQFCEDQGKFHRKRSLWKWSA